jgi:hypothetical protein
MLEHPLEKLTMPPPIAPRSTGRIAAHSCFHSSFHSISSFMMFPFLFGFWFLVSGLIQSAAEVIRRREV